MRSCTPFEIYSPFGAAPFDPLSLSPALWLADTGSDPSVWPDISGNGRDVTQASAGNQPAIVAAVINGRQVRRFVHTVPTWLARTAVNLAQPLTVVMVSSTTAVRSSNAFWGGSAAPQLIFYNSSSNTDLYGGASLVVGDVGPFAPSVWTARANGASSEWYRNGVSKRAGTCGANGITNLEIGRIWGGGINTLSGDIAEILFFPAALSTGDRQNVERYLGAKYGISVA